MELANKSSMELKDTASVGLIGGVMKLLRSVRISGRTRSVRVCETLALGERRQLLLVEWDSRKYLIGASQSGFTVLDRSEKKGKAAAAREGEEQ